MLGEKICEESGKITGHRVLPGDTVTMETSYRANARLLGIDVVDTGTYVATLRANGTLYGDGQGVQMSKDGDVVTWKGNGVGRFNANGSVSWRGAIYYQSQSTKFSRLNSIAAIFEWETDAEGNAKGSVFEWK
jgi:hypothetical protein